MPDPRDFLPQPPWEGPPVPRKVWKKAESERGWIAYSEAAKRGRVEIMSEPTPREEGGTRFYVDVYNEFGVHVLESVYDKLPDKIVLTARYARPGYARKGYGERAFIEGPLALAIQTGKPMMTTSLSEDGRAFYEALEKKGLVTLSENPDPEWYERSLVVKPGVV